ncbi:conserved hypothetical protein [uncultured Desulfobacterium sp.]|uniref:CoA-binding domain-containing protein n=1 Tax=uncultured Desulfobacterium sp. TaxID=201089 RepID=A0A445MSF0_9BACT|nr:conserved hypothetical protein [uncultured Desulfobacterium sp.]
MKRFFYPKSIAISGASADQNKVTNNVIANLLEMRFQGEIFPIGKSRGEIRGLFIHKSLKEIQKDIDLLVIMVPAAKVPDILCEAGEAGINRAVIITDGFNESGEEGTQLAKKITEIAEKYAIRFIGPNCQGVICSDSDVCVPFAPLFKHQVKKGIVSIVTQSGSIGWIGASALSHEMGGISKVASIGNKLDVDELDLLEYLIEDPETKIIVLYLESFSDGRRLFEIAKRSEKPIIVFKSNITGKESQIALSHTAALASDDQVAGAALAQAGILRAHTTREMIEMCKALSVPLIRGKDLAIMAGSGGLALIGEDTAHRLELSMAQLSEDLLRDIGASGLWKRQNITNPVDLGGFFNNLDILKVVEKVLSQDEVDGIALSLFNTKEYNSPLTCLEFLTQIEKISKTISKPIMTHLVSDHFPLAEIKISNRFPLFDTMEDAVFALSVQWKYRRMLKKARSPYPNMEKEKKKARGIFAKAMDENSYPNDLLAMELVSAYGISCAIPALAVDLEEARLIAKKIGFPVVMKISSPDILHKTDVGGVRCDIEDEAALEKAFHEMMTEVKKRAKANNIYGVMLQKMISEGTELILGGKHDKDFGPVIMFGMGGIFVEAFEDVSFRLAPICLEEAYGMIEEVRGHTRLQGVRGKEPLDIPSLADALVRLSILLMDFPEITEVDLNPIKLFEKGKGLVVVDGMMNASPHPFKNTAAKQL